MSSRRLSGLFINSVEANDSIYESGLMTYRCLVGSDRYSLDYKTISPDDRIIDTSYDFYFFNYHMAAMAWLDPSCIKRTLPGVKMTMVLEVSPNDPFVYCSPDDFDIYCVLDPTLVSDRSNVFTFPRPLEPFDQESEYIESDVPVIGSFGFATSGKGFDHLIDAVNKEFDRAIVRLNIPYSTYMDGSGEYAQQLAAMCKVRAKAGIEVIATHDYMNKSDLIKWCSRNTINCFLYDRDMPGLAATTDQAIASGRPLLVSKNDTFRHILRFIKPYPEQSLCEAIENTKMSVAEMIKAWSPAMFRKRFEQVLDSIEFGQSPEIGTVTLNNKETSYLQRVRDKAAVRTRLKKLAKMIGVNAD
jgi:glycosyltransferase involved in cell wall biosynthesis